MYSNLESTIKQLKAQLVTCLYQEAPDLEHIEMLRQRIVSLKKVARMFDDPDVIESNRGRAVAQRQSESPASFTDVVTAFNQVLGGRLDSHRADLYLRAWGRIKSEPKTVVKGHLCLISSRKYPLKSEAQAPVLELVDSVENGKKI